MRRVGFLLRVKPEKLAEYREHHRAVWPEMLEAHRRTGWCNYSLFAGPDGLVFGYFETPESLEAAGIRKFLSKPVTEAALAEAVFTALDSQPA